MVARTLMDVVALGDDDGLAGVARVGDEHEMDADVPARDCQASTSL